MILAIILIIFILYLVFTNIRIVPQAETFVIERLGKYKTTWGAGLHLKAPFIERVVRRVSMKEQVLDFPPQPVITKDNVTINIDSVVFAKVFDPRLYTYGVENPIAGLQNITATTLRSIIGDMELDETLTSREKINARMLQILDEATDPWGLRLIRAEVKQIIPPAEIEEVMTKQMRAERERRKTVLEAQAHKEAVVARAEGDKQAKILTAEAERDAQIALAEGKAKSIELTYSAEAEGLKRIREAGADESVLRLKGIEALKDVADGRATKIFVPNDLAGVLSGIGTVGEALGIGGSTPVNTSAKPEKIPAPDPCITPETGRGGKEAAATSARIHQEIKESAEKSPDDADSDQ